MFAKLAALVSVLAATPTFALWPLPTTLHTGSSALALAPNFKINLAVPHAPADLQAAVQQTVKYVQTDKLGRGVSDEPALAHAKSLSALNVQLAKGAKSVTSISAGAVADIGSRDESYTLTVPADGSAATLSANSSLGLFRGLTTFSQMWYDYNGKTYTVSAPYAIEDAPAYVRHFSTNSRRD
jgi:hexosaminidase